MFGLQGIGVADSLIIEKALIIRFHNRPPHGMCDF